MRDLAKKLALSVAVLALSLVAADLAFRLYEDRFSSFELSSIGPQVDLRALNFNETRVSKKNSDGSFRILSFGDSFAYGIVKTPYTYHSVAAQLLDPKTVRIINLGEPAIGVHRYMRSHEHWREIIEHDAVIFNLYLGNDIQNSNRHFREDDGLINAVFVGFDYDLQSGRKRIVNVPSKFPLRMLDYAYAIWLTWTSTTERTKSDERGAYNLALVVHDEQWVIDHNAGQLELFRGDGMERWKWAFEALIEFAEFTSRIRQGGKPVLILLSPNAAQAEPTVQAGLERDHGVDLDDYDLELPIFLIQEIFRRVDPEIPTMNLMSSLACAAREGLPAYHPHNSHWSVEGNQIVGEKIAVFARKRWFDADGPERSVQPCVESDPLLGSTVAATPERRALAEQLLDPLFPSKSERTLATGARP